MMWDQDLNHLFCIGRSRMFQYRRCKRRGGDEFDMKMKRREVESGWHTPSLFDEPAAPVATTLEPPVLPMAAAPIQPAPPAKTTAGRLEIHFDGGCLGNPGQKYGSFQVLFDGKKVAGRGRVDFGHGTNNEAEFNALKLGLDEAMVWLQANGVDSKGLSLLIETDSMIVRNRLMVKNVIFKKYPSSQRMFTLASECLAIMREFGSFDVVWKGRESNVEKFGH
jgi:ribonuclease HI